MVTQANEFQAVGEIQSHECYKQHGKRNIECDFPLRSFLLEWIGTFNHRIFGNRSEGGSKYGIDEYVAVDGPAIGVEHRTEVALTQLLPCKEA